MALLNRTNRWRLFQLLSLFSVVRGYNVLIVALAQLLAALFILAPEQSLRTVLLDPNLLLIVLASGLTIASGYIINNFYDAEKDLINKPTKSMLDRLVPQQFKLSTYFVLNLLTVFAASYISFKAVLFFSAYIFGIWLYSHKLKRYPLIGNLVSATLAIAPFFVIFIYYRNWSWHTEIFYHAFFLFLIVLSREFIKDLENIAGDLALNYKTVAVRFGPRPSKAIITTLLTLSLLPAYLLVANFDVGYMYLYFLGAMLLIWVVVILLWSARSKPHYMWIHNILKFLIVAGVFSILLIEPELILKRLIS